MDMSGQIRALSSLAAGRVVPSSRRLGGP